MQKIKDKTQSKSRFGMKSAFVAVLVLMAMTVSAAYLTNYGTITGTADVEQSIIISSTELNGYTCNDSVCTYPIVSSQIYSDSTHTSDAFTLTNYANNDVLVTFVKTSVIGNSTETVTDNGCPVEGVTTGMDEGVESITYVINNTEYEYSVPFNVPANDCVDVQIITTFKNACPGVYTIKTSVKPSVV